MSVTIDMDIYDFGNGNRYTCLAYDAWRGPGALGLALLTAAVSKALWASWRRITMPTFTPGSAQRPRASRRF